MSDIQHKIAVDRLKECCENSPVIYQEILDHYLLPITQYIYSEQLNQEKLARKNLRNGTIERETHGAMHASRVFWYIKALYRLVKNSTHFVYQEKMRAICDILQLSEENIIFLTQIAGLHHDAARQGEGRDVWEDASATLCANFLKTHGISENIARVYSGAIQYKDKQSEYLNFLQSKCSLDKAKAEALDYIRVMLHDADCLDIMRCVGKFEIHYLELLALQPQSTEFLGKIYELVKEVHKVIYAQYDMLYNCNCRVPITDNLEQYLVPVVQKTSHIKQPSLKDMFRDFIAQIDAPTPVSKILKTANQEANFSHAKKVPLEHSADLIKDMQYDLTVKSILFAELLEKPSAYTASLYYGSVTPDIYIHGTTSATLAVLAKTNFKLMSIKNMLKQKVAPMCGEFDFGRVPLEKHDSICFGRLQTKAEQYNCNYTLTKISASYCAHTVSKESCEYDIALCDELSAPRSIRLAKVLQAKQLGIDVNAVTNKAYEDWKKRFDAGKNFFYLILIFSKYFVLNDTIKSLKSEHRSILAVFLENTPKATTLIERIIKSGLDLERIWNSPAQEDPMKRKDLKDVLKLLELTEQEINALTINNQQRKCLSEAELLQCKQLWQLRKTANEYDIGKAIQLSCSFYQIAANLLANSNTDYFIADEGFTHLTYRLIEGEVKSMLNNNEVNEDSLIYLQPHILKYIQTYKTKTERFLDVIKNPTEQMILGNTLFLQNPFPIIFCLIAADKLYLQDFCSQEYRAKTQELEFGNDIFMVATDTLEHADLVQTWLKKYELVGLSVVLIQDLQQYTKWLHTGINTGNGVNIIDACIKAHIARMEAVQQMQAMVRGQAVLFDFKKANHTNSTLTKSVTAYSALQPDSLVLPRVYK